MPDGAQCERQKGSILFGHTLIDERTQPAIGAAIPILNSIAHVGSELLIEKVDLLVNIEYIL